VRASRCRTSPPRRPAPPEPAWRSHRRSRPPAGTSAPL
jgi:hypothetical protein